MVEISFTLVTTTISTIIVVTMATLFFCCWRKKSSRDIVAGKHSRHGPTKEEVKIDRSGSLTPSAVGKSENGVVTENQSATNGEMKLPLLSVTACADSNDDLGDFSAVQRETEILRSYRKPPPPKHRARQTRAPRHMKNGNESSNIFTELSEEDFKNENISDTENIASYDDADSSMLRSHSEDKTKSPREARSSMLADIEQTLAALYMSDQSEVVQPVDSAPLEHKTGTTEPVPEVSDGDDSRGVKTVADMNPELYAGDFVVSENIISSTSQVLISSEIKTESGPINLASSPKLNHTVPPKTGPKVSPKPSPKASARVSSNNARTSANAPVTKHKDAHESISVSVSESADDESSLDPAVISFKCAVSQEELNTTDIGVPEETSSCLQTILKTSDETTTNTEVEKPLDSTGSDILSIATDTVTISREGFISESTMIGSNDDKPETVNISVTTKSSEKPITYKTSDEDTTTEISRGNTTKSASEEGEVDFASQEQSESLTLVSDSKEQINTQSDANEVNETVPQSIAQGAKPILNNEAIEQDKQQSATETVLTDGSSQEDEKQRESSEDQTGKGKISKIPVRAGATSKSNQP